MGVFLPYNHMVFWVHFISESCTFCDLNSDFGNSEISFFYRAQNPEIDKS